MTTHEIKLLHAAWIRTYEVPPGLDLWSWRIRERNRIRAGESQVMNHPDFGWTMAMDFAMRDCHTDLLAEPPYRWVRHGIALLGSPGIEHGSDPDLLAVHQAMRLDGQPEIRRLLNATLLAFDATVERVAGALAFSVPAVEAYTALYFDVLDRKDDPAFLHTALRAGSVPRRSMEIPDLVDPVEGVLLLAGIRGTVADVVAMHRQGGGAAAA
ncbi:MAG: hypothetical protein K9N23_01485 [Akkermansiaceae bacterium]|nr:hypothetical protein [Akkermansiaceae bacterium]MCF7730323.1 hypothetical protein [Akkermansiaceae bacterium]